MPEAEARSMIRVDLHCHSLFSDGSLPPRALADLLADSGVKAASLTDHDRVEGLDEFAVFLARRDIAFVTGVELTTQLDGSEVHLLGYGFDPKNPELLGKLRELRGARPSEVMNVQDTLRNSASGARITTPDAIALIHRAGGKAFLAHPLHAADTFDELETLVGRLKQSGLDGIEALYAGFTQEDQTKLLDLAARMDLLVSAGTDLHAVQPGDPLPGGIDMPMPLWKAFRDAVCLPNPQPIQKHRPIKRLARPHWKSFGLQIVMPSFLALGLFIAALFFVFVPRFEASLLDRKKEMIRELTNSAWSILDGFHQDVESGAMSKAEAQRMAIALIKNLRYGREGKDYFWIQDTEPRMIMHPYRPDLDGQNISEFQDARGIRIFNEFAKMARRREAGYVDYVWQWKDDPNRLASKESYIRPFEPWGWVIGTGIYIEDVQSEIKGIERSLLVGAAGITLAVALLLFYVIRQSMNLEQERAETEKSLLDSRERYRSLVEATTEGTLLVTEGRCRYANPIFHELSGSSPAELGLLDLDDLFPRITANSEAWQTLDRLLNGEDESEGFDAVLQRRDGRLVDTVVSTSRIAFAERSGFILLVKEITTDGAGGVSALGDLAGQLEVGFFRARASRRGPLLHATEMTRSLLLPRESQRDPLGALSDALPGIYESLYEDLLIHGSASRRVHLGSRQLEVQAALQRDSHGAPKHVDGIVRDVTEEQNRRESLAHAFERLQRSLLFLHEPVGRHLEPAVCVSLSDSAAVAAAAMTQRRSSLAVVQGPGGRALGIVTDEDFRRRVVASGLSASDAVASIMTSPVVSISEKAPVFDALLTMERRGLHHLLVTGPEGEIKGAVRSAELAPFRDYGPLVLARDLALADSPEAMADHAARIPSLVHALIEGGAAPAQVSELLSTACDTAARRLIEIAQQELGDPPCAFSWVALGSHGRQEMTLTSDQDNALVYEQETEGAKEYFRALAEKVNSGLEACGFNACPGGVLARNPQWRLPLSEWRRKFTEWIALPEPQPLMEFTIIFDLRSVWGDHRLVQALREHIWEETRRRPGFYPLFAQSALQFRPPVRLFGRLIGGESPSRLDVKEALMPLSGFARLYALKHQAVSTGTRSRLQELAGLEILRAQTVQDSMKAFDGLQGLRLRSQSESAVSGRTPSNEIVLSEVTPDHLAQIQSALAQIAALQAKIGHDFLGGSPP